MNLKKLFFLLPLFFATIAIGMDKNPASLRYLAAAKVSENQRSRLPIELRAYAKNAYKIETTVKRAKEAAEIVAYRSQLKELCTVSADAHLCEEIYANNPHLYDYTNTTQMLKLCMQHSNKNIASWIFKRFPELKKDQIMEEVLKDTFRAHNLPMAKYILENNEYSHIYTTDTFKTSLNSKENVDLLLTYMLKELEKEAMQHDQNNLVKTNIVNGMHAALYVEEAHITEHIFSNYEIIRALCQELLFEKVSKHLSSIERWPISNYPDKDERCKFLAKFLYDSGKQSLNLILDRTLSLVLSAERFSSENVKFLLELGADPLKVNIQGQIPLQTVLSAPIEKFINMDGVYHYYIDKKLRETVQLLLSSHAREQVCHIDAEGNTALHYPSASIVIDLLTENGGNIERLSNLGKTPLLTFIANNTKAFTSCDNNNWGYLKICTNSFSQYLHSTSPATLKRTKPEIIKQLGLLSQKQFKINALKLLDENQPKWLNHTPKLIANATFLAAGNKRITMPENPCNKFYADVAAFVIKPEIKTYDHLYFKLKERQSKQQNNETKDNDLIERSPIDLMEDVD